MKKNSERRGFTLIELMISIVIFVIFLGIVSQSYISIVRAQRRANEIRKMYSDVRIALDYISEEVRLSSIDYACYEGTGTNCEGVIQGTLFGGSTDHLALVRQGGTEKTFVKLDDEGHLVVKRLIRQEGEYVPAPGYETGYVSLTGDNVVFDHLSFSIFPDLNPYSNENIPGTDTPIYADNGTQFQPKVGVYMSASSPEGSAIEFDFDFQTTISSRVYSRATGKNGGTIGWLKDKEAHCLWHSL
ncbi:MAG: type II secretion system protein [Candidatus Gracilibacteria bacterium]